MANKIIKYNLTAQGTIPGYINDGGYYPKANDTASQSNKYHLDYSKSPESVSLKTRWYHKLVKDIIINLLYNQ